MFLKTDYYNFCIRKLPILYGYWVILLTEINDNSSFICAPTVETDMSSNDSFYVPLFGFTVNKCYVWRTFFTLLTDKLKKYNLPYSSFSFDNVLIFISHFFKFQRIFILNGISKQKEIFLSEIPQVLTFLLSIVLT